VDGTKRDEMTSAAIARLAGVGRAAVSNWRKRYPEFPRPVGGSPTSPTFDRAEVIAWLTSTGKADQLATAGQTATGTQAIDEMEWIREREREVARLGTGARLLRALTDARPLPRSMARRLRLDDLLARTMVALLPHDLPGSSLQDAPLILDPACGAGHLLMAAADRFGDGVRLAGQDVNADAAKVAGFNLGSNVPGQYEIRAGDSLRDDQLPHGAAAVLCLPPAGESDWPAAELAMDPRWEFGTPAPKDTELAWLQHCYAHLRPRGVAVVAVSQRGCVQPSGEHVRAALIRQGVLRAVIALPPDMTRAQDITLWLLRRPHTTHSGTAGHDPDGPVRLVELSHLADPADLPGDHAGWLRLLEATDPTISRAVPRLRLLDDAANVLPARHIAHRAPATPHDLNSHTERLAHLFTRTGWALPVYSGTTARLSPVTLAELERVGALTVRPRDATPRAGDVLLRTLGRPPVVATGSAADDDGIAQVVEIDAARLDPHFVATFLRADAEALPVANTLGAINRDDLRRCRIPRMPLAEQRRYGDAFRQLEQLQATIYALANTSARIIDQAVYGLTTGALDPESASRAGLRPAVCDTAVHEGEK
jgi:SAM-dependent methyltransferase/predicted DNA-binding transcriptional regulator AlpA